MINFISISFERMHDSMFCLVHGSQRTPVAKFTEDFDFTAMNEKFKKDEVWGHLGKSNKSQLKDENGNDSDEDDLQDEDDAELPKIEVRVILSFVYVDAYMFT